MSLHHQVALRCPSAAYDSPACPSLTLNQVSVLRSASLNTSRCLNNHSGALCATCEAGFTHKSSDNSCAACSDYSQIEESYGISVSSFMVLLLVALFALVGMYYNQRALLSKIKGEVFTSIKIVIGLVQVLTMLKGVLSLVFPPNAQHTLSFVGLLALNIHSVLQFDCLLGAPLSLLPPLLPLLLLLLLLLLSVSKFVLLMSRPHLNCM